MEGLGARLMKTGEKAAAENVFKLVEDAYREGTIGAALCIPRVVCVGRKAI